MQALLLVQASSLGLSDLSDYGRYIASDIDRLTIVDGQFYYDLGGVTTALWQPDFRLPTASKVMTFEGWIISPVSSPISSNTQYLLGLIDKSFNSGMFLGFNTRGFVLPTGDGSRDNPEYASFPVNIPTHFAWVMNGVTKKLYINGTLVLSDVMLYGISTASAFTFGYADPTQKVVNQSKAKLHQLVIWNGVKYTEDFTPEYISYEQKSLFFNDLEKQSSFVYAEYNGVIADKVLIKGAPSQRKVSLYERATGNLVSSTWSDKAGNYRFTGLNPRIEYYVLALDHKRNYNAVIQDMLRAE